MKKYLLMMLSAFLVSWTAMAQDRSVSGTVTDAETGESIPGANIVEKGTSNGTITDFDGNYQLSVGDGATLVISFVGYQSTEIEVGSRGVIDVSLDLDVQALSEVVVVGYGTQEKKEITSSVASVKAEDFNKGVVNDPAQLLQGKVAGLSITRPGGDPNDGFNIRLRGVSTFGANSEPLVVIDGVIGASLATVDPNDIESIDVLKDGSAAAIYGTRGSSGVILVTTKSGQAGVTRVDYNASVAFEQVANSIEFMDANEYRQVPGAADLGSNTDWLDEVTDLGISNIHNLSLSGGTSQTSYRASVNLRDVESIGINVGFEQINARFNLQQKALKDRATFTMNATTTTKNSELGWKESFRYAISANPTLPVRYDGGTGQTDIGGYAERDIFDFFNPVSFAKQVQNDRKDIKVLGSLRADFDLSDLVDGLTVGFFYSQQRENELNGQYAPSTTKFQDANARDGIASRGSINKWNELFESTLNYNNSFGSTDIAFLGGYSYQDFFEEGHGAAGGIFLTDVFGYNNLGAAQEFPRGLGGAGSYAFSNTLIAFFGRLNFTFDGTFFLSASARYEGSSRFGENEKWGLFPAASAGVNVTNLTSIPGIDDLKIRASYGRTGNQPADSYQSIQRYGATGSFFFNGNYVPSFGPISNANPDLQWETKDEIDIGADFSAVGGKLTGTIDWYTRTTSDLLLTVDVPVPPNLFAQTLVNIGELKTNGFEAALNYQVISTSDFQWSTGVNFTTFKTTVESLTSGDLSFGEGGVLYRANMGSPGQNDTRLVRVKEGEELGQLWGPVFDGINDDGTPAFEDLDGDGSYCQCNDDKEVVGQGLPDFTLGWNNSLNYGNFDLNIFMRGAFGHSLLNSYRGFYENYESTTVGNYNIVKGDGLDERLTKAEVNSSHVEDASFFLLDNATLGYTVPVADGAAIGRLRLFVSVQRPFVITGYTGIDPEVRYVDNEDGIVGGDDALSPGIERRNTFFTTTIYTFGLNLGF